MFESLAEILTVPALQSFVGTYGWVWPICEVIHYIGMSLVIGIIGTTDLRILGLFRSIPLAGLQSLVPLAVAGFIGNLVSGAIMVMGNPGEGAGFYVLNLSFQLKWLAMILAFLNLMLFQFAGLAERVYATPSGGAAPGAAKVVALVSLLAWVFTIVFGRLLMYNDTLLYFLGL